MGIILSLLSV